MKKTIIILLLSSLICSCNAYKSLQKKDLTTNKTTIERKTTTRVGDTITIDVPNIRYVDTIIKRVNYENRTIASVTYDKSGNQKIECISAEIKEEIESIRNEIKNNKTENEEKEIGFNPQYFIYAIALLLLIIVIAIIVFFVLYAKFQNQITSVLSSIVR